MSGAVKSVKKVFKKVAKYAPIALGAAALVFTAGAALGVPGTAGGWGGAVSKLTQSLGAGDTLTNTLTGALTQAGYGAILGGTVSAIGGGDFIKGTQFGAAGGAVTGGLMGGLGFETDPLAGIGETAPSETGAGQPIDLTKNLSGGQAGQAPSSGFAPVPGPGGAPYGTPAGAVPLPGSGMVGAGPATAAAGGSGGLLTPGGWVERNQNLVGFGVQGLGQGLMAMGEGDSVAEAQELAMERDEAQRQYVRENYGSGDIPGYRKVAAPEGNPSPAQRFDPKSYSWRYEYDPAQGKIVKVQDA